jgi:hypothetical protein
MRQLSVAGCLSDAFRVYRTLFVRAALVAGAVYGALAALRVVHHLVSSWPAELLAVAWFVLWIAGPAVVQGAIVELVGNAHGGRPPRPVGAVLRLGRDRVLPLVGAELFYGLGVTLGLVLLIVPGLMIAARWSLLVPIIVLEERPLAEARNRSTKLVQEHTGTVLGIVLAAFVLCGWPFVLSAFFVHGFWAHTLVNFVASVLAAPFLAEVAAVIYYRLSEPERPAPAP